MTATRGRCESDCGNTIQLEGAKGKTQKDTEEKQLPIFNYAAWRQEYVESVNAKNDQCLPAQCVALQLYHPQCSLHCHQNTAAPNSKPPKNPNFLL